MSEPTDAEVEKMLTGLIGPIGEPATMPVEWGAARRMALALDNFDPIHFDKQAAIARGYRGIVAPWPLLWSWFFNATIYCARVSVRQGDGARPGRLRIPRAHDRG